MAGNLDDTRTLSIAIFNAEQAGRTEDEHALMWISLALGFVERFEPSAVQRLHAKSMRRRVMGRSGHLARCDVRASSPG